MGNILSNQLLNQLNNSRLFRNANRNPQQSEAETYPGASDAPPTASRRRPLPSDLLEGDERPPPSLAGSSSSQRRMRLRPRNSSVSVEETSSEDPSSSTTDHPTPLFSHQPVTVIVNVLNQERPNPPLNSILNAVLQALIARNPDSVQTWRTVPFFVIIRNSGDAPAPTPLPPLPQVAAAESSEPSDPSAVATPSAPLLLDERGNRLEVGSVRPDYSIFVAESRFLGDVFDFATDPQSVPRGAQSPTEHSTAQEFLRLFTALSDFTYEDLLRLEELIGYGHALVPLQKVEETFPAKLYSNILHEESEKCSVCLCKFEPSDKVRELDCRHVYHQACIDVWLTEHRNICPLCRRTAVGSDGNV